MTANEPDASDAVDVEPASSSPPDIGGLYVFPELLDTDVSDDVLAALASSNTFSPSTSQNQVMLFPSPSHPLPAHLLSLLTHLSTLLRPLLPPSTHDTLFAQPLRRQVILNLYRPGEGIAPHVDLPTRYADGVLGVALLGSATMDFESDVGEVEKVWLGRGTIYALTGEARWGWSHGIVGREWDWVADGRAHGEGKGKGRARRVMRGTRVSVTFRWMKDGADVLGG